MVASPSNFSELTVDLSEISDWKTFHAVFKAKMGFPDFYGASMDAWIDCMTCIDAPDHGMTQIHVPVGSFLCLSLESVTDFRQRCPEIFEALADGVSFVNYRRLEMGDPPILLLSYHE